MACGLDIRSDMTPTPHSTPDGDIVSVAMVEAAEQMRCAALIAADGSALRSLFADDATWLHSSGKLDDCDAFIAAVETGEARYLTIDRSETAIRLYGKTAVSSGIASMTALTGGQERQLRNRYTNVWIRHDNNLQLVSSQSTKVG